MCTQHSGPSHSSYMFAKTNVKTNFDLYLFPGQLPQPSSGLGAQNCTRTNCTEYLRHHEIQNLRFCPLCLVTSLNPFTSITSSLPYSTDSCYLDLSIPRQIPVRNMKEHSREICYPITPPSCFLPTVAILFLSFNMRYDSLV